VLVLSGVQLPAQFVRGVPQRCLKSLRRSCLLLRLNWPCSAWRWCRRWRLGLTGSAASLSSLSFTRRSDPHDIDRGQSPRWHAATAWRRRNELRFANRARSEHADCRSSCRLPARRPQTCRIRRNLRSCNTAAIQVEVANLDQLLDPVLTPMDSERTTVLGLARFHLDEVVPHVIRDWHRAIVAHRSREPLPNSGVERPTSATLSSARARPQADDSRVKQRSGASHVAAIPDSGREAPAQRVPRGCPEDAAAASRAEALTCTRGAPQVRVYLTLDRDANLVLVAVSARHLRDLIVPTRTDFQRWSRRINGVTIARLSHRSR
jgi:hypothetical protein